MGHQQRSDIHMIVVSDGKKTENETKGKKQKQKTHKEPKPRISPNLV